MGPRPDMSAPAWPLAVAGSGDPGWDAGGPGVPLAGEGFRQGRVDTFLTIIFVFVEPIQAVHLLTLIPALADGLSEGPTGQALDQREKMRTMMPLA